MTFWEQQPPGYQRTATWLVISAKQAATRERRLARLMEFSARGERIPELVSPGRRTKK